VPSSALTPLPSATIKPLDPAERRDVVVAAGAPHDDLIGRFVSALKQHGLPSPAATARSGTTRTGSLSRPARPRLVYQP
jgi:hypothetical protein